MKKATLWGLGLLVAIGFIAYLLSTDAGWAERRIVGPFDPTNAGAPGDNLKDDLGDRPGDDRNNDRTPDSTPDRVNDLTPDCVGNFARDFRCGGTGDLTPEDHEGDGSNTGLIPMQDGIPDASRFATINRSHDGATDRAPDWPKSDTYLTRIGLPTSVGDVTPDGRNSTAKIFDRFRDALGRDLTPDSNPTNTDGVPDGSQDRGNFRDRTRWNPGQAAKDAVVVGFGPGDKTKDNAPDTGGLSTITTPCTVAWPVTSIATSGKGQSQTNNPKVSHVITGNIVNPTSLGPKATRIPICMGTSVTAMVSGGTATTLTSGITCTGTTCLVVSLTATEKYIAVSSDGKDTDRLTLLPQ